MGGQYLIGLNAWKLWTPVLTFFGCLATFVLNRRNDDHLVYKRTVAVKKEAKKLLNEVKKSGIRLIKRGKVNLKVLPDVSDIFGIIVMVWSTKKRRLAQDGRNGPIFHYQRPQLELLRSEDGRFCIITNLGKFLGRQVCVDCHRGFSSRRGLEKHKKFKRCPYFKFIKKFPDGSREDFFETPYEEYMVERRFPKGRIKPQETFKERLQELHIHMPPNFRFKRYFCVSDIESFLKPLPHKFVHGEEEMIYSDLEGLIFMDVHKPSAVSVVSNLGDKYSQTQCFVNMDGGSAFLEPYCRYLYEMSKYQEETLKHQHEVIFEQLAWKEKDYETSGRDPLYL